MASHTITTSAPLQGLLGGVSLAIPVFVLLTNSGNVFGISGFMHRTLSTSPKNYAWWEGAAGVLGLVGGGAFVGFLQQSLLVQNAVMAPLSLPGGSLIRAVIGGFLVGLGSKLQNGCTSGHMICGFSRFSVRSIVATAVFFATGVVTTGLTLKAELPHIGPGSWSLVSLSGALLLAQAIPMWVELGLAVYGASRTGTDAPKPTHQLRILNIATASFHFALALQLGTLNLPQRVVSFLALPFAFSGLFDPTLLWLAVGALPLSIVLYRIGTTIAESNATLKHTVIKQDRSANERTNSSVKAASTPLPLLGGNWSIPNNGQITPRLLIGAALFGIGWALEGVCPGPALVNLGLVSTMAKSHRDDLLRIGMWLTAFAVGGVVAP